MPDLLQGGDRSGYELGALSEHRRGVLRAFEYLERQVTVAIRKIERALPPGWICHELILT
jgi:hypothetical protein